MIKHIVNYLGTVIVNIFLVYVITLGLLYNNVFYVLVNPYYFLAIITVLGFINGHGSYMDYYFGHKEADSDDK